VRVNRFYFPREIKGSGIIDDPVICNQVKRVLRLAIGDELVLFDGEGLESLVQISSLGSRTIAFDILGQKKVSLPKRKVNLFLAILKKENFDWAVLKSSELGVANIFPLITDKTVKLGLNYERLNTIIKEGAEQSGRNFLTKLSPALKFEQAVNLFSKDKGVNLLAETSLPSCNLIDNLDLVSDEINIWIGPEGGWSDREISLAHQNKFNFVSLGENILRAETATVVASWWLVNKK